MQSRLGLLSKTVRYTKKIYKTLFYDKIINFGPSIFTFTVDPALTQADCLLISLFPSEIGKETHRNSKNYNTKTVCTFPLNPAGSTVTTVEVVLKVEAHHTTAFKCFFSPTPTRAFSFNIRAWLTLNSCNDSFTHTASVLFVNYSAPGINSEALSL